MIQKTFRILLIVVCGALAACNGYSKVLKSQNPDIKYRAALQYYEEGKYKRTAQLLEDIAHFYVSKPQEDTIAFLIGASYYRQGDFEMSGLQFDHFRKTYGRSPFLEEAEYMLARGYYLMSPRANRDQTPTRAALMAIDEYIERYPNSPKKEVMQEHVDELTQKLHDKAYINAKSYYTTGKYKSAVVALRNALNQYPDSSHREEIMYLIVKSSFLLADNSIVELQRDRYMDMMDAYYSYQYEYRDSRRSDEIEKMYNKAKQYLARFSDGEDMNNDSEYGN